MLTVNMIVPMLSENASRGLSIAGVGMMIVACALILICLFIAALPRVLAQVARVWPESDENHVGNTHPESFVPDDESVVAAIGFALRARMQNAALETKSSSTTT